MIAIEEDVRTHCELRSANLNDWEDIKSLYNHFQTTKATEFIQAQLPDLQSYLANSLVMPDKVGFIYLKYKGCPVGLASVCIVLNPQISELGMRVKPQCFINAAYVATLYTGPDSSVAYKVPSDVGKMLLLGIEQWGHMRGADWVFGNVRVEKRNVGFVRKYGFDLIHQVIGKKIGGNENG